LSTKSLSPGLSRPSSAAASTSRRFKSASRDRFYKTPLRPKTFRTPFHTQILYIFALKYVQPE
jgi:hypothetical protein